MSAGKSKNTCRATRRSQKEKGLHGKLFRTTEAWGEDGSCDLLVQEGERKRDQDQHVNAKERRFVEWARKQSQGKGTETM